LALEFEFDGNGLRSKGPELHRCLSGRRFL